MSGQPKQIDQLLNHLFRHESGKLVSLLTRVFGTQSIDLAEDVVQESFMEAINTWPYAGVPANPSGWLYTVAKNKAINVLNKEKSQRKHAASMAQSMDYVETTSFENRFSQQPIEDDQLRMIFVCCHPILSPDSQVALTLKTLCGFSIKEIANAFLTNEETINKRLVRARQKIREDNLAFEVPPADEIDDRLHIVLKTIYLLFNEGYRATTGDDLIRYALCEEAIRLTGMIALHHSLQEKAEVFALLALMQLNASRFAARQDNEGNIITLDYQDRSRWNQPLIARGITNLEKAAGGGQVSVYHILGTISAYHCMAPDFAATDWAAILSLYDNLVLLDPSPLVLLNRAIALAKVQGVATALQELNALKENPALQSYPLFFSTQAHFFIELGQHRDAAGALEKAIRLNNTPGELKLLRERLEHSRKKIVG